MQQDFIPFGAQYYRAPTPLENSWENDLKNIKAAGFNTVKIWAQWRWNNPLENVYDFSDLEKLMNLSEKYGLKVIINIILDVAPAWFYEKYPESVMVKADGTKLMPQSIGYRQIGGAPGPCYHNPEAQKCKDDFTRKLAEKFSEHPALYVWDLWNEPELTCGLAREASKKDMVCYCAESEAAFKIWLGQKYGSIENLNNCWQKNYNGFEQVELPRNPDLFKEMVDWRTFFAETLTNDLKSRINCVKKYDKKHPVMVHTVPPPYFNMVNACCNDYQMAKVCDLFGNSIGSMPFPAALSVSNAAGKTVINAEIHALGGDTFNRPGIPTYNGFKKHIFTPFAKGIKGFLFWQYRPERLGTESPAWGLTDLAGNRTDHLEYATRINNLFIKHNHLFCDCKPEKSEIAIVKDDSNEIFCWCADRSLEKYNNSLKGIFDTFYRCNYNVDIITTDQIKDDNISQYKMIYYPIPYYLNKDTTDKLKEWIYIGGTLISEAFFGAYCDEDGLHSETVPGYGFDRVFGAKEGTATTASSFIAAYGDQWSQKNQDSNLFTINYDDNSKFDFKGYYFYEELIPEEGSVIARFSNGKPAIVKNKYGKGNAVIAGSLLGAAYAVSGDTGIINLLKSLADKAGIIQNIFTDNDFIRADILTADCGQVIIINNESGFEGEINICFNSLRSVNNILDIESEVLIPFEKNNYTINFKIQISPNEIKIYQVDCF